MKLKKTVVLLFAVAFFNASLCNFGYCGYMNASEETQRTCCSSNQEEQAPVGKQLPGGCEGCSVSEGKVLEASYESLKVPAFGFVYLVPKNLIEFQGVSSERWSHDLKVSDSSGKRLRLHRVNCAYLL